MSLGLDVFREEDDQLEMKVSIIMVLIVDSPIFVVFMLRLSVVQCVPSAPASALHLPLLLGEDPVLFQKWMGQFSP